MAELSNISSIAEEKVNTPGVMTPILEVQPQDGTGLVIENFVNRGDEVGIPIYGEFLDANGDPLPQDTDMALQFEAPTDDDETTVSEPKKNLRPYRSLSIQEQQNEEYVDRVKHVLKGNALAVEDVDRMYVSVKSSAEIDWSNSRLTFDENAVSEV